MLSLHSHHSVGVDKPWLAEARMVAHTENVTSVKCAHLR